MPRSPRDFRKPMALGAPPPLDEIPITPSRSLHFFDPSQERMRARVPQMAQTVDVLVGNLEDAVPSDRKVEARRGLIEVAKTADLGNCSLWTRVNSLDSPWVLDDFIELVGEIGQTLDVIMIPKVTGPWDIHYADQLLAQLEGRHGIDRPILIHAILETAGGVNHVEEIAQASPRMQGMSLGPSDLAASRRMKTTRVGGGHPGYLVREDPDADDADAPRATAQQDLWHYTLARMVDACVEAGALPYYGPFGDIADPLACEDQFRAAFLMGCVGAWSLHPSQVEIANRVFSPPPDEVAFARRIDHVMGDGSGVVMLDGKMQDDATYKQAQVILDVARLIADRDPAMAALYRLDEPVDEE